MSNQRFDGAGEFLAGKMRRLNRDGVPMATVITWFSDADVYERCKEIFTDGATYHESYDAWLQDALKVERDVRAQGMTVLRAHIDPEQFLAWCNFEGYRPDHHAREKWSDRTVKEWMERQQRSKK